MPFPSDLPPHEEYADVFDADDWNVRIEGHMAEHASDDEPEVDRHFAPEVSG